MFLSCDIPLRHFLMTFQAVTADDDAVFTLIEQAHELSQFAFVFLQHQFVDGIGLVRGGYHVDQRQFTAVFILADRIVQRACLESVLVVAQVHQDFVFNTAGNISCQLMPFIDFERVDPFDQTNRADADEVFGLFTADIEFLYDVRD